MARAQEHLAWCNSAVGHWPEPPAAEHKGARHPEPPAAEHKGARHPEP